MAIIGEKHPFHILLIEDNPGDARLVHEMITEMLEGSFVVEIAERLSSGCERLKRGGIDIVLLDLILPDSESIDTLRAVQRCAPKVPIIVLSVIDDEATAMEAVGLGAQEYLFKGQMDSTMLYRAMQYAIKRKDLEMALRDSEERFRLAAENYPAVFIIYDGTRRIEFINEFGAKLLGRSKESLIGQRDEDFVPPEMAKQLLPALEKAIANRIPQEIESSFCTPSGKMTYVITYVPVFDENGNLIHLAAFTKDITARKRTEDALRESETRYRQLSENLEESVRRKVDQLQRMKSLAQVGQMVSVVAHEIRNPLQNIRMGIDSIRACIGDDPQKEEILGEIDHGVNLLNETVTELLEYSKPMDMRKTPWPISEICNQAIRGLSHLIGKVAVEVNCKIEQQIVYVDGSKLIRVLMNLITNSIEAMPEGGKITISSDYLQEKSGDKLRLLISDTGRGIPADQLLLVQEPFFTTKLHGTGLGLAICRKIIEAHDGAITINSKLNEGTTVEIILPAHAKSRMTGP